MKSADELKKELAALESTKAATEQTAVQDVYTIPLEEHLDFTKYPITGDERKRFDLAVADYNRRRHAVPSDPNPDDIEGFVAMDRKVERALRYLLSKG